MAEQDNALVNHFMDAVSWGDLHETSRLLDSDPALLRAVRSVEEGPPLTAAAFLGDGPMATLLLARGADPEVTTSASSTALARAIYAGHVGVGRLLLNHGATPRVPSGGRAVSALYYAALCRQTQVLLSILEVVGGEGINERGDMGDAALCWACFHGCVGMARALLLAGADPTILNGYNMRPKMVAQREGYADVVALLEWWEGEAERAYVLYRAFTLHQDYKHHQAHPDKPLSPYLFTRVADGHHLPRLEIGGEQDGDGEIEGEGAGKGKEEMQDGGAEVDEEMDGDLEEGVGKGEREMQEWGGEMEGEGEMEEGEVCATLRFVLTGLCPELGTELHDMMRVQG